MRCAVDPARRALPHLCLARPDSARRLRAEPIATERLVSADRVLSLAPLIVFRFDEARQRWIMPAPERLLLPDEQAVEILKLLDGKAGVGAIIDTLAGRYTEAPGELIARDVTAILPRRQGMPRECRRALTRPWRYWPS
jgi:pyrroloquinoline quinone biosynthesis protein D